MLSAACFVHTHSIDLWYLAC